MSGSRGVLGTGLPAIVLSVLLSNAASPQSPAWECEILVPAGSSNFEGTRWTNGRVPYEFSTNVTGGQQQAMRGAMDQWEGVAPVRFVLRTTEPNYLFIQSSDVNNSHVGMRGGSQTVKILNWDIPMVMAHELGHALGLWHEQQRPDRDRYVRINWENIQSQREDNFAIIAAAETYGPYDFDSIMHYPGTAFSRNGSQTITVLPPMECWQSVIGNRVHLSNWDAWGMSARYGGPGAPAPRDRKLGFQVTAEYPGWGFQDQDRYFSGDVNGDGRSDVMIAHDDGIPAGASLRVAFSEANGRYSFLSVNPGWGFDPRRRWFPGDVDGDGKTDFMMVADNGPTVELRAAFYKTVPQPTFEVTNFPACIGDPPACWTFDTRRRWFPGDVNGDGRTDFMMVADNGADPPVVVLGVAFSQGRNQPFVLRTYDMSTGPRWSFNTYRPWFPGDVNGDGKTDFMMVADSGGNSFLCVAFVNPDGSYSTRTVNSGWPWFGHWRWFPGDLNGDGRTDFLLAADSGPGGTISLIGNLSDGTGASWTPIRHETGWGWETDQRWFAADVTGDGADDFVRIASHSGTDLFACGPHAIILAASLQSTGTLLTMLGETNYGWSGRYWWFPEDADGDGKDDILLAADSGPGNTSGLHTARLRDLPALSSSVGQGCGGGLPKLTSSRPVLGQSLGLQVTGAPASAAGQMLLSARPAGALGLTCQCQAFLDPVTLVFLFPFVTSSGGGASASVPLPAEQTIAGLALRMQALATGGSCGFVLTNGIDLVLGIE